MVPFCAPFVSLMNFTIKMKKSSNFAHGSDWMTDQFLMYGAIIGLQ